MLGIDYFCAKKNVTVTDYKQKFMNHPAKIEKGREIAYASDYLKRKLLQKKLDSVYVDYDGSYQKWFVPWSKNPRPLAIVFDLPKELMTDKDEAGISEAEGEIDQVILGDLVDQTKRTISIAKQKFEAIKKC